MLPGGTRKVCLMQDRFPGLDLHDADPAQRLTTADSILDDLDHDLSECNSLLPLILLHTPKSILV